MKVSRRRFLHAVAGAVALPAVSRTAYAQTYPTRTIRLVIPFPPGGAFDFIGRPWADKMKSLLGTIVVENIGGGGSSLGATAVVCAPHLMATRFCWAGRKLTSTKHCSKAGHCMIRSRTWTR